MCCSCICKVFFPCCYSSTTEETKPLLDQDHGSIQQDETTITPPSRSKTPDHLIIDPEEMYRGGGVPSPMGASGPLPQVDPEDFV